MFLIILGLLTMIIGLAVIATPILFVSVIITIILGFFAIGTNKSS